MKALKKMTTVIVGYGNRGQIYGDFSLEEPDELEVLAVVDPNPHKLEEAKSRYHLAEDRLFRDLDEFLAANLTCDFVVNATMDQMHYETSLQLMDARYNLLLEKPIVPTKEQLRELERRATEKQVKVFVCHVLRYTPFYSTIKKLLNQGRIGEIVTMEMNEHVCVPHYLASYTRGKWNSEVACGSGFLLAKSCHDLDIMCWLNNASAPKRVTSFGNRSHFLPERAPERATEYCYQCPHEKTCQYSALDQYLTKNMFPFLVWDRLDKPFEELTEEEKMEFLKTDIYGKCAYKCGGDLVDRQNAIVEFENGSMATFNLVGGSQKAGRYLHIVGTLGEIEGYLESDQFTLRTYEREYHYGKEEVIEVHPINNAKYGGHSGGDYAIMHDLIRYLNGDDSSVSITALADSINGHLCVFAAEESRREERIVSLEK